MPTNPCLIVGMNGLEKYEFDRQEFPLIPKTLTTEKATTLLEAAKAHEQHTLDQLDLSPENAAYEDRPGMVQTR